MHTVLDPQSCLFRFFNDLQTRGERLRPLKSSKTVHFVDRIVDRKLEPEVEQNPGGFEPRKIVKPVPPSIRSKSHLCALLHLSRPAESSVRRFARFPSTCPFRSWGIRPHIVADHPSMSALAICHQSSRIAAEKIVFSKQSHIISATLYQLKSKRPRAAILATEFRRALAINGSRKTQFGKVTSTFR